MLGKILGRIRGAIPSELSPGTDAQIAANARGELLVAAGLPPLAMASIAGQAWQVKNTTGLDNLTALPTTTAGLSIWNNPASGAVFIITSFGSSQHVVDATQANHTALFAMMNVAGSMAAPTDAALAIRGLSGQTAYTGQARTLAGGTVTDHGWFPHVAEQTLAPAVAGAKWKVQEAKVDGLYVVKPGGMFSIASVQLAAVTASQFYFIRWIEAKLPAA
jgi:nucleoid-associated protein YgaU